MLYVKKVTSALKGGVDVELGEKTLLVGPNGSGKSAAVQAIELATSGWVSDMEGRERVKLHTALARLFPNPEEMYSKAALSNDRNCLWEMKPKKKPTHDSPVNFRWPIQDLIDTFAGEASTVQSWLEKQVVGELTEEDVLKPIDPDLREEMQELMKKKRKTDFLSLAKEAKQEAKNLRAAATRTEKTIEQMTAGVPTPMLEGERKELESQLEALLSASRSGVSQDILDGMKRELEEAVEKCKAVQQQISGLPEPDQSLKEVADRANVAAEIVRKHIAAFGLDSDVCWACGNESPDFLAHAQGVLAAQENLGPKLRQIAERITLQDTLTALQNRAVQLSERIDGTKVIEDHTDELEEIRTRLSDDNATKKTWDNAAATKKEVEQLRGKADKLTKLANALEPAGKKLLRERKVKFEEAVSQFLPSLDFAVDLDSSRLGIERDGIIHSAVSGGETNQVLLALASSLANSEEPSILVPRDRAWDPETLTRTMGALTRAPAQIILMSTIPPAGMEYAEDGKLVGEAPKGWTVVQTG